ncbi:MAG: Kelch repeat-containing protein [Candidatus Limnocylindrales bacterium]
MHRPVALALGLLLLGSTLAPASVQAASGWTVSTGDGAHVAADFVGDTSGTDVTLALSNQTSITPFGSATAAAILNALGFGGGYSQEATWPAGADPSVNCPGGLVDLPLTCRATSRTLLIPGPIQASLTAHAASPGAITLGVAPDQISLAYDVSVAAVGMALEALVGGGSISAAASQVGDLALQLSPEAASAVAALLRHDDAGALAEILALAKQAAQVIIAHTESWVEATGLALALDLVPGVLEVRLGIAAAQAIVVLANLAAALLTGQASTAVAVGYGASARHTGGTAAPATTATTLAPYQYQGVFSPIGSMSVGRMGATATLLADGRVLVAGGQSTYAPSSALASAELYDPRTGTFSPTGSMSTPRAGHTATLLADGQVLITGGSDGTANALHPVASAELYDTRTGTFSPTGTMSTPRYGHTATLLADGRVLIAGTILAGASVPASAELYDPSVGTFSPTGSMLTPRYVHDATLLPDGRVLITGGVTQENQNAYPRYASSAELYDPQTGTFSPTGPMSTVRDDHTATLLTGGRVLVAGGLERWSQSNHPSSVASAELYDPATSTFSRTGSLNVGRAGAAAVLLHDGRVLVVGGWTGNSALNSAELYDPLTGLFSLTASLNAARAGAMIVLLWDGSVLVAGGFDGSASLSSAEVFR